MVKKERWGKECKDERDWKECNEKLVRRGEFYISLDWLNSWGEELEEMNRNKRGRPFEFTNLFIQFMASVYTLYSIPYRQMEGFLRKLSSYIPSI